MATKQRTIHEMLKGQKIVNVYEGRPDGSILIRLQDRTEIVITKGLVRETLKAQDYDKPIIIGQHH